MTGNWFLLAIVFSLFSHSAQLVHLTSLECRAVDKAFNEFEYCHLKAVNRTYKYISLKAKLFKLPITNISVRFALKKRANGYKPFLYDLTFDGCKFLEKKNNPVINYFYGFFETHSNINHTCPYNHDLMVHGLDTSVVENQMMKLLPFPPGDYAMFSTWFAYNEPRATVNIFALELLWP